MSDELPDECPECGCDDSAFVKYKPDPNPSQTPFARHSPDLYGVTCMECGRVHGVIAGEENNGVESLNDHQIDETLE